MNSKVSIVKCAGYHPADVQAEVGRAIELAGGISNFIKPSSRVLVKPNLLMPKEPEFGITTHPEVLRAVIRILKSINCQIIVGDGPSVWGKYTESVEEVYRKTGTKRVCEEESVELVKFDKRRWRGKFPMTTWLDDCDHLVSISKFKTHELALLTAAVKNNFGLVSGSFKTELHKNYFDKTDFSGILMDIYQEAKPALNVVDGILAMEGDGPATAGKLRNQNILVVGSDAVAVDSVLSVIMGIKPHDVLYLKEAARRGIGNTDLKTIEVLGENIKDATTTAFLLPASSRPVKIPSGIVKLATRLIKYLPCVKQNNCIKCASCIDACPKGAVSFKDNKISFDYSKCISCFCCQEACPASAIKVRKSWFAKMIGL